MLGLSWLDLYQTSTFAYPAEYLLRSYKVWQGPGVSKELQTSVGNAESTVAVLQCCNGSESPPAYI